MPQFTVYRNKSARSKTLFPLLVDVQSDLLEDLQTRAVIPLSKAASLTRNPLSHLMPVLKLDGEAYVLMTPELAAVAQTDLGAATGSLAGQRDAILAALDFLLTGF
jgi:toxin CcdB